MNQTRAELEQTKERLNTTLLEMRATEEKLKKTTKEMNQTRAELEHVKKNPDCPLNSTVTSPWDLLYSDEFFGGVLTTEKLEVLRKTTKEIGNAICTIHKIHITSD
jgi:hypothetical protein